MCKDVECGGGRGAIIGEEDTVEEPAEQSIAIDDVPSLVELIDDSLNDYEYKVCQIYSSSQETIPHVNEVEYFSIIIVRVI